ncbi:MAG: type II 3-dehydroquinate dehydratase [Lentisphaeria bacterium]|nr:type II 3-dehydroquinate dehydratase [Lentisphaeria bacterium]
MKILLLNGPNLQLLGSREPEIYGRVTLDDIVTRIKKLGAEMGFAVEAVQSNSEGEQVTLIGSAPAAGYAGIIINPAAYTHTSVAIRDAIAAAALPAVEVHLSNIMSRESFRHESLTAPVCIGVVAGFGAFSYELALRALAKKLLPECADPKNTSSR